MTPGPGVGTEISLTLRRRLEGCLRVPGPHSSPPGACCWCLEQRTLISAPRWTSQRQTRPSVPTGGQGGPSMGDCPSSHTLGTSRRLTPGGPAARALGGVSVARGAEQPAAMRAALSLSPEAHVCLSGPGWARVRAAPGPHGARAPQGRSSGQPGPRGHRSGWMSPPRRPDRPPGRCSLSHTPGTLRVRG